MGIKTYQNDGQDWNDGLGPRPPEILVGGRWSIAFELDRHLRNAIRDYPTMGVSIKNSSTSTIRVKFAGSEISEVLIAKKAGENVVIEFPQAIVIENAGPDLIDTNELVVTVTLGAASVSGATGLGDIFITQDFTGAVYADSAVSANAAAPLALGTLKLADVVIAVETDAVLFGDITDQVITVNPGEVLGITKLDLSTLWFRSAVADQHGTVNVLGVFI